jgi:phage tail-like protein
MTTRFDLEHPLHVFRFQVDFKEDPITAAKLGSSVELCSGAFSECSGLEATMEPRVIKEGGRNYGAAQRAGPVTFATVILKRGMTSAQHLWKWFEIVGTGGYAHRLAAQITVFDMSGQSVFSWQLRHAMPVKFKAADLNATSNEVGIEELHLAHEGLYQVQPEKRALFERVES